MRAKDTKDARKNHQIRRHRRVWKIGKYYYRIEVDTRKQQSRYKRQDEIADVDFRFIGIAVIKQVADDREQHQRGKERPFQVHVSTFNAQITEAFRGDQERKTKQEGQRVDRIQLFVHS